MLRPNTELGRTRQILVSRRRTRRRVVHAHIVHDDAPLILTIETTDIGARTVRLQHDGNPMQLLMARVEDVSRPGHQTVAPQKRSNAVVRLDATAWGDWPSI